MKYLELFLIIFALVSCNRDNNDTLYKKLQGDWLYNNVENSTYFISIRDSLFFGWELYNDYERFYIHEDTLKIPSYESYFVLSRVTDKYIWIKDAKYEKDLPIFYKTDKFYNSNIILNNLEIRFVNYWYRGLTDWSLHINRDKECFLKVCFTKKNRKIKNPLPYTKGNYFINLKEREFNLLQDKLRKVPLERIDDKYISENYELYNFCTVLCEIKYNLKNSKDVKTLKFIAQGDNIIPNYLGVFVNYLNKLPALINFKESEEVDKFKLHSVLIK